MTTATAPAMETPTPATPSAPAPVPEVQKPGDAVIQFKIAYVQGADGALHPTIGQVHFEGENEARQFDAMNAFKASGIGEKLGLPMLNFGFEGDASVLNAVPHTGAPTGHSEVQVKYDTENPGRISEICIKGHSEAQLTAAIQAFGQSSLFGVGMAHSSTSSTITHVDSSVTPAPDNPMLTEIARRHGQAETHTHTSHGITTHNTTGHLDLNALTDAERKELGMTPHHPPKHAANIPPANIAPSAMPKGAATPAGVTESRAATAATGHAR